VLGQPFNENAVSRPLSAAAMAVAVICALCCSLRRVSGLNAQLVTAHTSS
jgi:hypothetical protein